MHENGSTALRNTGQRRTCASMPPAPPEPNSKGESQSSGHRFKAPRPGNARFRRSWSDSRGWQLSPLARAGAFPCQVKFVTSLLRGRTGYPSSRRRAEPGEGWPGGPSPILPGRAVLPESPLNTRAVPHGENVLLRNSASCAQLLGETR